MKPRRIVLIVMLVLAAGFASVQIYYQVMTQRMLRIALQTARDYPNRAYWAIQPVRKYGDFWTWGESSQAVRAVMLELYNNSVTQLFGSAIQPRAYTYANGTLLVMRDLQLQGYPGIDFYMGSILKAARDSVPRLQEDGSYAAWQGMMTFYRGLSLEDSPRSVLRSGLFKDYDAWMASLTVLDERNRLDIYFRDVARTIADDNRNVRDLLGFDVSRVVAGTVLPLAPDLPEPVCRDVYGAMEHGIALIYEYQNAGDRWRDREIQTTLGVLKYNEAALMVAHLQDLGPAARRIGSSLIARIAVTERRESIPAPDQMVDEFLARIQQNIMAADDCFLAAAIPEQDRAGLLALNRRVELEMIALDKTKPGPMELARAEMQQELGKASGDYRTAAKVSPGRPVFLLRIPDAKPLQAF